MRDLSADVMPVLISVVLSILILFVYFLFARIATERFAQMADCMYESDWLSLPVQFQKDFIVIIANAQRPLYYQALGIVILNMETFTSVCDLLTNILVYKTDEYFKYLLLDDEKSLHLFHDASVSRFKLIDLFRGKKINCSLLIVEQTFKSENKLRIKTLRSPVAGCILKGPL